MVVPADRTRPEIQAAGRLDLAQDRLTSVTMPVLAQGGSRVDINRLYWSVL